MIIAFLGRQPALGLAELESLLGADAIRPLTTSTALLTSLPPRECGGIIKFAEVFATTTDATLPALFSPIKTFLLSSTASMSGRLSLGISLYNLPGATAKDATAMAYKLKKALPRSSIRNLQNTAPALSSAQVIHGKLLSERGFEIVILRHGTTVYLARTLREQNLAGYTARDHGRPKRDAFVGMLPPKLAQIMINLAHPSHNKGAVLDPFCGTGVVLQEALLYGYSIAGSDLSEKMIEYSRTNLTWLKQKFPEIPYDAQSSPLIVADAMTHAWPQPISAVVAEGYLGTPFSGAPTPEKLQSVIKNCNHILSTFLKNIASQLQAGTPLCLALPCWFVRGQIYHLPLLDDIAHLGYNYKDFTHVSKRDLMYHRENQIVGRELLVITKQ